MDLQKELRVLGVYVFALIPLYAAMMFLMGLVAAVDSLFPAGRSQFYVMSLNLVPSALLGLIAYGAIARHYASPRSIRVAVAGHPVRTLGLYALVLGFCSILVKQPGGDDFGLWSQLILWPIALAGGGITADLLVYLIVGRRSSERDDEVVERITIGR